MTDEERRVLYDNVYSKLLTLLERCQKYVHHLNNKVKQSIAEHHHHQKTIKNEPDVAAEDDIKRTGLLKKYYEMTEEDIQSRQPKLFVGALKPCKIFCRILKLHLFGYFSRSISWFRMVTNIT
jgi:hypothetical protein